MRMIIGIIVVRLLVVYGIISNELLIGIGAALIGYVLFKAMTKAEYKSPAQKTQDSFYIK